MSIVRNTTAVIYAVIVLNLMSCSAVLAQVSCQDLRYGSPQYTGKMNLAKQVELPGHSWNRYHESLVRDFAMATLKALISWWIAEHVALVQTILHSTIRKALIPAV
jgi:hypothetical protein